MELHQNNNNNLKCHFTWIQHQHLFVQIHVHRWNIFEAIFSVILKIKVKILNISSTSNSFSRILWNKYLYNKSSLLFVDLPPFNAVNFKLRMNSAANFTQIAGKLMHNLSHFVKLIIVNLVSPSPWSRRSTMIIPILTNMRGYIHRIW